MAGIAQTPQMSCGGYTNIVPALRFELLSDAVERRSYSYFFEVVGPQSSGHHEKGFWTIALRQISHANIALLHAVAALGAIEEHHHAEDPLRRRALRTFALAQYGQSLSGLRKSVRNGAASALVILVGAVLHITMELRQKGEQGPAKAQLRTALRFLASSHRHTPSERAVLHRWIRPMLGRRLLQFEPQDKTQTLNDGVRLVETRLEAPESYEVSAIWGVPGIDEAHHELQSIIETTFTRIHRSASNGCTDEIEHALSRGRACLQNWQSAFDQNFAQPGNNRETLLPRILCQSAILIIQTVISTSRPPHDEDFARQIDACEAFMQLHKTTGHEGGAFFVDHAVIPSLFFAAVQCKDASLSARAMRILQNRPWREGFWDSRDVAEEARRVRGLFSERALRIDGLGEHPYLGCAWEFLGGCGLIVSNRDAGVNTFSKPP
ncbi:hypothetical protein M409DRAFT_18500 [Zasmidium cellare ATCC 36951]|uniref:Transcription factor domain-containing protein n=1 Tax=Zasmidium cellare ATCC 36951 TaxID=1080233 RepID=A0A6A6CW20_ZASCE|nr:uncharacterized protein M409DRAFT_18500 [Zasmidium cellare ATCC 36951]KAF2171387.1 hypothetical protein M409DRAFT_18500 [Zasmidium cellare ATCC 36951]